MSQEGREEILRRLEELEEEEEETRKRREKIKKEKEELKQKLEAESSDIYLANSDDFKAEEIQETETTEEVRYETVIYTNEEADTNKETAFSLQEDKSYEENFSLSFFDISDEETKTKQEERASRVLHHKQDYPERNVKSKKKEKKLLASTKQTELNTQEDSIKRFDKRPGFATVNGVYYEVKMCMLVFLRLLNLKANFSLCSNLESAGDFDDVVAHYRYNYEVKGRKHNKENGVDNGAIFIQLKHTDNQYKTKSITLHKGNPDFRLLDYYISLSLCDSHLNLKHEIFSCDPDKRLYLIFTNANVNMTLLSEDSNFSCILNGIIQGKVLKLKESGKEYEDFVKFLENINNIFYGSFESQNKAAKEINECISTKQFIVKGEKQKDNSSDRSLEELKIIFCKYKDININVKKITNLFSKMRICCCQANVKGLDGFINDEIQAAATISPLETENVFKNLHDKFITWHDNEFDYLTGNSKIWTDICKETRDMRPKNMEMRNLEIEFDDVSVSLMTEKIKQFRFLMVITRGGVTTLSTLKILQALESFTPQSYLLVSIKECTTQSHDLWNIWPNKWCKILAIEIDAICEDVQMVTEKLFTECVNNGLAKVIFICPQSITLKSPHIDEYIDDVNFSQLEKQSKEQILHGNKINFQGQDVYLDNILQEKHIKMLGVDQLTSLIKNEFTFGRNISDYNQKGYISRNIDIPYISEKIFNIKNSDMVVAIQLADQQFSISSEYKIYTIQKLIKSCNEKPSMYSKCHFVKLKEGEEMKEFEILCEMFSNVHWIEQMDKMLVWKKSKGEFYSIRNYVNYSKNKCEEDFLETSLQTPVVISGEPGMGKSSLLKHMAVLLQEKYPDKWIVLVELAQYCEIFKNCGEMTNEKMFEFIIKALHLKFEISFFTENPEFLKNFIILLDGFDEVCPHYINEAEKLTEHIIKSSYFLCITCRESYCSYLEENLRVISYRIQPFNKEMKEKLLTQCVKGQQECLAQETTKTQSENISLFSNYFNNDQYKSFTGNPLNLLMLFEICDAGKAKMDDCGKVMPVLNIFQVFKEYIKKKCERFHREKIRCDTSNPIVIEEIKKNIEEINEENKRVSAYQTFYNKIENESSENKKNEMSQSALNYSKNFGVIEMIEENTIVYTHKLFVDYFSALWLVDNFMQNQSIVKRVMFEKGFETVRKFFDLKCSEDCDLLTAILTEDLNYVNSLINTSSLSDIVDVMGRTALHLIVMKNDFSLTERLLSSHADVNIKDKLGLTPLDYAVHAHSWESMNVLLKTLQFTNEEHYKLWTRLDIHQGNIIFRCCERGLKHLLKFVSEHVNLNNYFFIVEEDTSDEKINIGTLSGTRHVSYRKSFLPIEVAVRFDQINTVEQLQGYNCDINFRNHGLRYEVKMCVLVFLKLLNLNAKFSLCSNLKGAGNFDDLVVHYYHNNKSKVDWRTLFIQLKHVAAKYTKKSISFYKGNPFFKLLDYFLSFSLCDNNVDREHEIFCCNPDKRLYLLFTNADVDRTLLSEDTEFSSILDGVTQYGEVLKLKESEEFKEFQKFLENLGHIFNGSSENQDKAAKEINECINTGQFRVNPRITNNVSMNRSLKELKVVCGRYKDMNVNKITDFFLKLRICCCQPNVFELDDIIKREIQAAVFESEVDTNTVFHLLLDRFSIWHYKESYYLNQIDDMWTDILKDARVEKEMRNFGIKLNDDD